MSILSRLITILFLGGIARSVLIGLGISVVGITGMLAITQEIHQIMRNGTHGWATVVEDFFNRAGIWFVFDMWLVALNIRFAIAGARMFKF